MAGRGRMQLALVALSLLLMSSRVLATPMRIPEFLGQPEAKLEVELPTESAKASCRAAAGEWRDSQKKKDKFEMEDTKREVVKGETYRMGPKVKDWDLQRADYIRKHPGCNATSNAMPKVMLVTGSQPGTCGNDVGDFLLLRSIKNKMDYVDRRPNMQLYYSMAVLDYNLDSFWTKQPLVRKLMLSHPEVEWFWWMDSDAIFTDMLFDVPWHKYENYSMVMHGYDSLVYGKREWTGLNAGIFLIRNNQWSLDMLDDWIQFGVKGEARDHWGVQLSQDLTIRPLFEGDDQSGIVWLMVKQPERFQSQLALDFSYELHGDWIKHTGKYEEYMDKFHPGLGDERWPLVTHFVGCKPCGKVNGAEHMQELRTCVEAMERAFNFADNQVLRQFGYEHVQLSNPHVHKINVTTYKASEFGHDPLGMLKIGG